MVIITPQAHLSLLMVLILLMRVMEALDIQDNIPEVQEEATTRAIHQKVQAILDMDLLTVQVSKEEVQHLL